MNTHSISPNHIGHNSNQTTHLESKAKWQLAAKVIPNIEETATVGILYIKSVYLRLKQCPNAHVVSAQKRHTFGYSPIGRILQFYTGVRMIWFAIPIWVGILFTRYALLLMYCPIEDTNHYYCQQFCGNCATPLLCSTNKQPDLVQVNVRLTSFCFTLLSL